MANADQPRADWERVAAELRAYRDAQAQTWGGIHELVIARYLSGTCTPQERETVERVAAEKPAVAELLAIVRAVCGESTLAPVTPADAARRKKVSEATVRVAIASGELRALPGPEGDVIPAEALAEWNPKSPVRPPTSWSALAASTGSQPMAHPIEPARVVASRPGRGEWLLGLLVQHVVPAVRRVSGIEEAVLGTHDWFGGQSGLAPDRGTTGWRVFRQTVATLTVTVRASGAASVTVLTTAVLRTRDKTWRRVTAIEDPVPRSELPVDVGELLDQTPGEPIAIDVLAELESFAAQREPGAEAPID